MKSTVLLGILSASIWISLSASAQEANPGLRISFEGDSSMKTSVTMSTGMAMKGWRCSPFARLAREFPLFNVPGGNTSLWQSLTTHVRQLGPGEFQLSWDENEGPCNPTLSMLGIWFETESKGKVFQERIGLSTERISQETLHSSGSSVEIGCLGYRGDHLVCPDRDRKASDLGSIGVSIKSSGLRLSVPHLRIRLKDQPLASD